MTVIEEGIKAALEADGDVSALVVTRVWFEHLPQNPVYPAITYQRISSNIDGMLEEVDSFTAARFQIVCWATNPATVLDLAKKVKTLFHGASGLIGGVMVQGIHLDNQTDAGSHEPDKEYRRCILDFVFYFHE